MSYGGGRSAFLKGLRLTLFFREYRDVLLPVSASHFHFYSMLVVPVKALWAPYLHDVWGRVGIPITILRTDSQCDGFPFAVTVSDELRVINSRGSIESVETGTILW